MAIRRLLVSDFFSFTFYRAALSVILQVSKSLAVFGILVDALGIRFNSLSDKYTNLLFDNANTGYAEVRTQSYVIDLT
jgi:hypothetical protein